MKRQGKRLEIVDLPRLCEIDRLLSLKSGATVTELAARLAVSSKTVYRDLALCRVVYGNRLIEIHEAHNRKRYRIEPDNRMFATWVSERAKRLK